MTEELPGIAKLGELMAACGPVLVLTGAGISTDSGIPAYRDDNGNWIHSKPVQAADFYNNEHIRKRYWLRSMLGWPRMQTARPNDTHHALTRFEQQQRLQCIVTQNVDNLHQGANSNHVVDLHGNLQTVVCLHCEAALPRQNMQEILQSLNPRVEGQRVAIGPDGDAATANLDDLLSSFKIVECPDCGGVLKPDVVFFGENVPAERVSYCMAQLQQSAMLLCLGTSLTVFSGFRFCRAAKAQNIPIALINQGKTRADDISDCVVNGSCAIALDQLSARLTR